MTSSSRSVRPQRSVANMSSYDVGDRYSSRTARAPPLPKAPRSRSVAPRDGGREDDRSVYRSRPTESVSSSSSSSLSSSGSSFLDRMKAGSGYASSRTSVEDEGDYYPSKRGRDAGARPAGRDVGNTYSRRGSQEEPEFEQEESTASGFGSSLWSRVASAAGTLTVNVGKAWATNVTTFAGEETPEGQESRLTRAMKAYHLEKARDPADLPEWLFDESERRPARSRYAPPREEYEEKRQMTEPPKSRGLRDVYDAAATSTVVPRPGRSAIGSGRRYEDDLGPTTSKATDRLKAMREAKRSAGGRHDDLTELGSDRTDPHVESERRAPPRIGLPSGPGVRPRRR